MIAKSFKGFRAFIWITAVIVGIVDVPQKGFTRPAHVVSPEGGGSKPRKLALLVGINVYQHSDKLASLEGAEDDVDAMRTLLTTKFGFSSDDVVTLKGPQATRDAIINDFRSQLTGRASKGDIVLFHFSGHGSRMKDAAEAASGGWDQTIVPYDSRDDAGKVTDIRDKELNTLIRELSQKTDNITVILDSCFSGTGIKGAVERVRSAAPDERFGDTPPPSRLVTRPRDADGSTSGLYSADLKYALIAASRSNQFSFEYYADDKEHGALTYFLTKELSKTSGPRTYQEVMDIVAQDVNGYYPMQSPQLEGTRRDRFVLDIGGHELKPYVSVSVLNASQVSLAAGEPESLTVGSLFDIYRSGSDVGSGKKPIATVKLTAVE